MKEIKKKIVKSFKDGEISQEMFLSLIQKVKTILDKKKTK